MLPRPQTPRGHGTPRQPQPPAGSQDQKKGGGGSVLMPTLSSQNSLQVIRGTRVRAKPTAPSVHPAASTPGRRGYTVQKVWEPRQPPRGQSTPPPDQPSSPTWINLVACGAHGLTTATDLAPQATIARAPSTAQGIQLLGPKKGLPGGALTPHSLSAAHPAEL
ncbi:hypothetical protein NDU88_001759 [Pleurodeles waltl]|uniref:Uncharacterized protein n=1 Tax=Pleurodeles waltl TaxID=8319 RepID=A0AAV7TIQ8_PLEWA|nr:hypothetical protein NDU88_001759 [Pleurodeles waltl]